MVSREKACVKKNRNDISLAISFKTNTKSGPYGSSIRFHELTGTFPLMAVFFDFLDATELKAAAEEKRRVRAATNFIVVDFGFVSWLFARREL
jgi:hypothetical protein